MSNLRDKSVSVFASLSMAAALTPAYALPSAYADELEGGVAEEVAFEPEEPQDELSGSVDEAAFEEEVPEVDSLATLDAPMSGAVVPAEDESAEAGEEGLAENATVDVPAGADSEGEAEAIVEESAEAPAVFSARADESDTVVVDGMTYEVAVDWDAYELVLSYASSNAYAEVVTFPTWSDLEDTDLYDYFILDDLGLYVKGASGVNAKKLVYPEPVGDYDAFDKPAGNSYVEEVVVGDGWTTSNSAGPSADARLNFEGCTNLKKVTIGNNVRIYEQGPFKNCPNLESVVSAVCPNSFFRDLDHEVAFSIPSQAYEKVPSGFFEGCSWIDTFDFSKVKSVGQGAFNGTGLNGQLIISAGTSIGARAFRETGVTSVTIGSGSSVGQYAFSDCDQLTGVTVDANLTSSSIFSGCTSLSRITIGPNVTTIATDALRGLPDNVFFAIDEDNSNFIYSGGILYDSSLNQLYPYVAPTTKKFLSIDYDKATGVVDNLVIASDVDAIEQARFHALIGSVPGSNRGILKVEKITVEAGNTAFKLDAQGVLYTADGKTLLKVPCGLTQVTVPAGVERIAQFAFAGCEGLTSLSLPEGLKYIDDEAFCECRSLASIELPGSLVHIGNGAFESTVLTSLKAPGSLWKEGYTEGDFVADGGVSSVNTLFFGWSTGPDSIKNNVGNKTLVNLDLSSYGAAFLPHYAFAGLLGLEEVIIPANVVSLGYGTFYHCSNLKDAYFYSASGARLLFGGAGEGNSGSGNANESYSVTNPGSFSDWDDNAQNAGGTGSKFVDVKSLNVHGVAYSQNPLIANCASRGWTFKPIVLLQDAKGLFGSYTATYGPGVQNYNEIQIADIVPGGTPVVKAVFGDYDKARVLNFDSACAIEFTDAAGNPVSSFDAPGTYLARITGDGKGVIGARSVAFRVIDPNAATSPQPQQPTQTAQPSKPAQPEVKTVTNTVTNTVTRYITSPAPAAVAPAAPAAVVEEAVEEAPAQTGETSIPMTSGSSALAQSRVADAATPLATSGLDPAMQTGMNPWLAALAGSLGTLLAGGVAWLGVHLFRRNAAQQAVTATGAAAGGKRKEDEE